MLHKVTLGGSGTRNVIRHPNIGDNVLLGAGATLLGSIKVGRGANIGACSMVLEDIPENSVAVGVPAKVIKRSSSPTRPEESPATEMNTNLFYDI
jgi:serine O-acetyltransferase